MEYIINTTNMPDHVLEVLRIWYINNEQIVRCKDCRFCHKNYCEKLIGPTASPSEIFWIPVEPDGFCKWARPKAD